MPYACPEAPKSSVWVYVTVVVVFLVAIAVFWGLVVAQKRVYPDEVRLYATPVPPGDVRYDPAPRVA
jgi:hypothetical protein